MTLRWIEGFEAITTSIPLHERIYPVMAGPIFAAKDGATEPTDESLAQDVGFMRTGALVGSTSNSWIVGFAFQVDDFLQAEGGDVAHFAWHNTDGEQCRIEFADYSPVSSKPQGGLYKIRFMRGVTEICSSVQHFRIAAFSAAHWIYFEFKVTIDNASGSIEGRYKFMNKPSLNPSGAHTTLTWDAANTSIDSQDQSSTGCDRVEWSWDTGDTNEDVVFDDIYVCDSLGSKNNDYLGKCVVVGQKPLITSGGDGDTLDWTLAGGATSTYDALFESLTAPEDDERLTSDTLNEVHLHTVVPLTVIGANAGIIGVRHDIHARMETTGDLDISHYLRKTTATAGETEVGALLNVDSTSMKASTIILEDEPNTATDWVKADMDSYQYGFKNKG